MVVLCFTPAFVLDPSERYKIGQVVPYLCVIVAAVNLLMQVHAIWWQVMFRRRRRKNQLEGEWKLRVKEKFPVEAIAC